MHLTRDEAKQLQAECKGDYRSQEAVDALERLAKARTAQKPTTTTVKAALVAPSVTEKPGKHNAIVLDSRLVQDWPGVTALIGGWPRPEPGDYCSKTEARFVQEQLEPRVAMGQVTAWAYEMLELRSIAGRYTPDFVVVNEGELEIWEVKGGHIWPRDLARLRAIPLAWPVPRLRIWQWKGGVWSMERVGW